MKRFLQASLLIIGIITASPIIAAFFPEDLTRQYNIEVMDQTIEMLLMHRGILQGALGFSLLYGVWNQKWIIPSSIIAIVTKASFIFLIIVNSDVRANFPALPIVFDSIAIVVLFVCIYLQIKLERKKLK